ncbi:MAG: hypothetical protein AAF616_06665 [Bacteroidota bacterium]
MKEFENSVRKFLIWVVTKILNATEQIFILDGSYPSNKFQLSLFNRHVVKIRNLLLAVNGCERLTIGLCANSCQKALI